MVSLSLNSDNFTRNIKSINKQIQEAESAFRLASAGVDNFETTTAGLSFKLSTLQRTFQLQETSIETQRAYFEHEIGNHPGWKLVQIYADQGVTGTISMKRPAFRQMIEDALAGKIDYILIKSISRFSRNTVDCLQYVRMLREKGVYLHFEKENIDTSSAYSEMLVTVLAAFAQEESVSISENIAWSFRKKYEAGIPRRFVLFGYRLDEDGE